MTHSARPPVSSSSVAAAWAISVGSRSTTPDRLGPEPDVGGLVGGRGEQQPHVLVPRLVGGVAAVEAELVRLLDGLHRVGERVVGKHHVAEPHRGSSLFVSRSVPRRTITESAQWACIQARCSHRLSTMRRVSHAGKSCCLYVVPHQRGVHLVDVFVALHHGVVDPPAARAAAAPRTGSRSRLITLVRLVEQVFAGVHDVERVEHPLDLLHDVPASAELLAAPGRPRPRGRRRGRR